MPDKSYVAGLYDYATYNLPLELLYLLEMAKVNLGLKKAELVAKGVCKELREHGVVVDWERLKQRNREVFKE